MSDTLFEYFNDTSLGFYIGGTLGYTYIDGITILKPFQTFTPQTSHSITSVKLGLSAHTGEANPEDPYFGQPGNVTVEIKAVNASHLPIGDSLATVTVNGVGLIPQDFEPAYTFTEFTFTSSAELEAGTEYAIIVSSDDYYGIVWNGYSDSGTDPWADGKGGFFYNGTWSIPSYRDLFFEVYGEGDPPEKPENVTPADAAEDVEGSAGLEWLDPGAEELNAATGFDLYFGSSAGSLGLVASGLTAEQVTATAKQVNDRYYSAGASYAWRVDAFNDAGTTTGDVWTFDVISYPSFDPDREKDPEDPEDPDNIDPDGRLVDDDDFTISGGGRHSRYLVEVGHKTVYIKKA